MSNRLVLLSSALGIGLAIALFAPPFVAAQSSSGAANAEAKNTKTKANTVLGTKPWSMPRTPDGKPDLHGYCNANPQTLKITERFKRVAADQIEYSFTIDDPSTWTKPWTAIVPLSATQGPFFEYACSENNMDIVNIMAGARATEKAAEEKTKIVSPVPISQK